MSINKNYFNKFIRTTEKAAIGAYPFIGKGDKNAADKGSVDMMRNELNKIDMRGEVVIGEGEKHPAAIIQPAFDFLKEWCRRKEIPYTTNEDMIKNERVFNRIMKEVDFYNEGFAQYEKIKKILLVPTEWAVESGEMTPTMKVKRRVIMENYKNDIEAIYRP